MAFPCEPMATGRERELLQVNMQLNVRIDALEASLATARADTVRECAAVCEAVIDKYHATNFDKYANPKGARMVIINACTGASLCQSAILALLPREGST